MRKLDVILDVCAAKLHSADQEKRRKTIGSWPHQATHSDTMRHEHI
jgi:hypothetical protein